MPRPRTDPEVISKIEQIKHLSVPTIARVLRLPLSTVYQYTRNLRPSMERKKRETVAARPDIFDTDQYFKGNITI